MSVFCVFFEAEEEKGDKNVKITTWVLNAHVGGGSNCFFLSPQLILGLK